MMSMTFAFAENENTNAVNNAQAYDMSVNMNKLGQALGLSWDQMEFVSDAYVAFNADMKNAAMASDSERKNMLDLAVRKNLANMRVILTQSQYHKYLQLLNVTFKNRGLK